MKERPASSMGSKLQEMMAPHGSSPLSPLAGAEGGMKKYIIFLQTRLLLDCWCLSALHKEGSSNSPSVAGDKRLT